MSYQVLARKYRPQSFDEVIGQEHITRTLKNAAESERVAHGYLFSGMRGVGKTTMARILAKALNCEKGPTASPCNACGNCREITEGRASDVIEIDGASNTGVDDVRELRENVLYAPARTRYKIYIIDEVHMLSKQAFNALLKTLEEPPEHVIFVFATTEPHKVPITIKSRCQCFEFHRIPVQKISDQLLAIADREGFSLDADSARLIGNASEGSMRDAQSLLDQVLSFCGDTITASDVRRALGVIDEELLEDCTSALLEQDTEKAMNMVERLHSQGVDLGEFCKKLQSHLRNLLMIKILKSPESVTSLSEEDIARLRPIAGRIEEDSVVSFIEHLNKTEEEVRRSTHPKILLELALIKMARTQPLREFKEILTQIEALEQRLAHGRDEDVPPEPQRNRQSGGKPVEHAMHKESSDSIDPSLTSRMRPIDWEKIVSHANRLYPPIGSLLEHGFLKQIDQRRLVIGFKKKIHYEMAQEKREKILEILGNFVGGDPAVRVSFENGSEAPLKTLKEQKEEKVRRSKEKVTTENLKTHVVQEALRIFKGRILDVRDFSAGSKGR